jgi:hypothetical protein
MIVNDSFICVIIVSWKVNSFSILSVNAPVSNDYSLFSGAKQTLKAVYRKKFTAFFIKTIEFF